MKTRSTKRKRFAAVTTMLVGLVVGLTLMASVGVTSANASVRTAATEYGKAELVQTLPISTKAWAETRSVMSLGPERVGSLIAGDRIEAGGDFEVTVCLKPNPLHPGNGQPCVGDLYPFNPTIKAKLVLATGTNVTSPGQTRTISKTVTLTCRQDFPARNHHCVISVPWSGFKVDDISSLPCDPGSCHINMLATVYHPDAHNGHKVVLGSSDDNARIHQGLARLSSVRYRPGTTKPSKVWRGGRATKSVPVVSESSGIKRKVIYSAKVSNLKAGDQLVVDARARTAIGHLPYNVFQRTEVVFAKTKSATTAYGKVLETTGRVSAANGLNCTQGKSAHHNVCDLRKTGVLSIRKNAKGPFYVNIVVGQHAIGPAPQTNRWRSGDQSKVPKNGFVRVERYKGAGSCSTCSTGWTKFSAGDPPSSGRPAKLVAQLKPFGITEGSYNCLGRSNPTSYVCKWRASGSFGDSPSYECETRATWSKQHNRFSVIVCKPALGANLWEKLAERQPPIEPSFAGACSEQGDGDYRCKWFAEALTGAKAGRPCKGFATYRLPEHSWVIDACKP